ncbi:hypothetical protein DFH28DRAFT_877386, partial [Melampsora americana]
SQKSQPARSTRSQVSKSTQPHKKRQFEDFKEDDASDDNSNDDESSSFGKFEFIDQEDEGWEDEEKVTSLPETKPQSKPSLPKKTSRIQITLANYQESDLDITTIDTFLHNSARKTRNRIPADVQKELKNIQFIYRRAKKLLALVAHCSEHTVNEFL